LVSSGTNSPNTVQFRAYGAIAAVKTPDRAVVTRAGPGPTKPDVLPLFQTHQPNHAARTAEIEVIPQARREPPADRRSDEPRLSRALHRESVRAALLK
jgi:hypothetical protein